MVVLSRTPHHPQTPPPAPPERQAGQRVWRGPPLGRRPAPGPHEVRVQGGHHGCRHDCQRPDRAVLCASVIVEGGGERDRVGGPPPLRGREHPSPSPHPPRQVTVGLLQDAMRDSGKGVFLIDGFPRNEENRAAFEEQVGQRRGGGRRVDALTLAMDP